MAEETLTNKKTSQQGGVYEDMGGHKRAGEAHNAVWCATKKSGYHNTRDVTCADSGLATTQRPTAPPASNYPDSVQLPRQRPTAPTASTASARRQRSPHLRRQRPLPPLADSGLPAKQRPPLFLRASPSQHRSHRMSAFVGESAPTAHVSPAFYSERRTPARKSAHRLQKKAFSAIWTRNFQRKSRFFVKKCRIITIFRKKSGFSRILI